MPILLRNIVVSVAATILPRAIKLFPPLRAARSSDHSISTTGILASRKSLDMTSALVLAALAARRLTAMRQILIKTNRPVNAAVASAMVVFSHWDIYFKGLF